MSPFLLLAALFPAAALLVRVYRLDKIEKEPPRVLWTLIGCGALAAMAAYALQCVLLRLLDGWLPAGGLGNLIVRNFLIVACSEELCKRLPVRTVCGIIRRLTTGLTRSCTACSPRLDLRRWKTCCMWRSPAFARR